jgi:hypothetical protein
VQAQAGRRNALIPKRSVFIFVRSQTLAARAWLPALTGLEKTKPPGEGLTASDDSPEKTNQ